VQTSMFSFVTVGETDRGYTCASSEIQAPPASIDRDVLAWDLLDCETEYQSHLPTSDRGQLHSQMPKIFEALAIPLHHGSVEDLSLHIGHTINWPSSHCGRGTLPHKSRGIPWSSLSENKL